MHPCPPGPQEDAPLSIDPPTAHPTPLPSQLWTRQRYGAILTSLRSTKPDSAMSSSRPGVATTMSGRVRDSSRSCSGLGAPPYSTLWYSSMAVRWCLGSWLRMARGCLGAARTSGQQQRPSTEHTRTSSPRPACARSAAPPPGSACRVGGRWVRLHCCPEVAPPRLVWARDPPPATPQPQPAPQPPQNHPPPAWPARAWGTVPAPGGGHHGLHGRG